MKRAPTLRELLEAKEREHLAAAAALREAIEALDVALDGNTAPRGCDLFTEDVACSPIRCAPHVCLEPGCGRLFVRCAMHGGSRAAADDLAAHRWTVHGVDDRERKAKR